MKLSLLLTVSLVTLTIFHLQGQSVDVQLSQGVAADTKTWSVDFMNKTGKPLSVDLHIVINYAKKGAVIEFSTDKILVDKQLTLLWTDVVKKLQNYTIQSDFKDAFYGDKVLPSGDYQLCLLAVTGQSVTINEDCLEFSVQGIELFPPLLLAPSNGDTIAYQFPTFTWSPPGPLNDQVALYDLYLYEITKGQTPAGAVAKNQPYHQAKGLKDPFYSYPAVAFSLKEDQAYAWQIVAWVGKDVLPSNIENFVFGKTTSTPPTNTTEKTNTKMYFQLGKSSDSDFYQLYESYLNFVYVSENTEKAIGYSITDSEGIAVTEGKLKAAYGYNFFSIDLSKVKVSKDKFYHLVVSNEHGPDQQLLFLVPVGK